jgi:sporulation protein YlmC with PRC-barrel domain
MESAALESGVVNYCARRNPMRSTQRSIVSLGVLLLVAGLPVSAQCMAGQPTGQPASTTDPAARMDQARKSKAIDLVPADRLMGANIVGNEGDGVDDDDDPGVDREQIGGVNDFIVDRSSGRIMYALAGQGGVLGLGEHVVAVPFTALMWNDNEKNFFLSMTREQLKAAPGVDGDDWKTLDDSSRADQAHRYFGITPHADDEELKSALSPSEWPLLRVSDIRGKTLMSDDGRELGEVNDLIVDASSGRIAFGVVTFGGTLGFGADKVAIPWPMLDVNKEGGLYAPKLDKELMKAAPRLTEPEWGELDDPKFGSRVYSYFNVDAPWLDRMSDAAGESDTFSVRQYEQAYMAGTERTVLGTIMSVDESSPMKGLPDVTTLTVKADDGQSTKIHIAPKWYLEQNRVAMFKAGDKVAIKGRAAMVDGKEVLIASEVPGPEARPLMLRKGGGEATWVWR